MLSVKADEIFPDGHPWSFYDNVLISDYSLPVFHAAKQTFGPLEYFSGEGAIQIHSIAE